jgi:hypothetical protein
MLNPTYINLYTSQLQLLESQLSKEDLEGVLDQLLSSEFIKRNEP